MQKICLPPPLLGILLFFIFAPLEGGAWMPPLVQTAAEKAVTAFLPKGAFSPKEALTESNAEVMPNCSCNIPGTVNYTIGEDCNSVSLLSATPLYPYVPVSSVIWVKGTLIVDTDYSLSTMCTIYMDRGARIIVQSGVQLGLNDVNLLGCDYLWKEIYVEPSATLWIKGDVGSQIADAEYAVHLANNATLKLEPRTRFLNNYVGVYFNEGAPSTCAIYPFRGVSFEGASSLKPHYDANQTNYPWSYAGMEIHDMTTLLQIGALYSNISWQNKNAFKNMRNGLLLYGTDARVLSSDFENLQKNTADYYPTQGYGVRLDNGSLQMEESGAEDYCSFNQVERCVLVRNGDVSVGYTQMSGIERYGVRTKGSTVETLRISISR